MIGHFSHHPSKIPCSFDLQSASPQCSRPGKKCYHGVTQISLAGCWMLDDLGCWILDVAIFNTHSHELNFDRPWPGRQKLNVYEYNNISNKNFWAHMTHRNFMTPPKLNGLDWFSILCVKPAGPLQAQFWTCDWWNNITKMMEKETRRWFVWKSRTKLS